jgi:hypothetical protein
MYSEQPKDINDSISALRSTEAQYREAERLNHDARGLVLVGQPWPEESSADAPVAPSGFAGSKKPALLNASPI